MARLIREDTYTAQPGAKFPIKWTAPEVGIIIIVVIIVLIIVEIIVVIIVLVIIVTIAVSIAVIIFKSSSNTTQSGAKFPIKLTAPASKTS